MEEIKYTTDAFASLVSLVNFIETKNTKGAGVRWLQRYEEFLKNVFKNYKRLRFCKNKTFKRLKLQCIYYNGWLIAFTIHENFILIETLLHKSRISD